jgi:hypothetical protein
MPHAASRRTTMLRLGTFLSRTDAVLGKVAQGRVKGCGWHGMQGVRGSNPLSSTLGLDEHGRAQHLAVTSSASDRAIALTWQLAPRRPMMPRKPKPSMT